MSFTSLVFSVQFDDILKKLDGLINNMLVFKKMIVQAQKESNFQTVGGLLQTIQMLDDRVSEFKQQGNEHIKQNNIPEHEAQKFNWLYQEAKGVLDELWQLNKLIQNKQLFVDQKTIISNIGKYFEYKIGISSEQEKKYYLQAYRQFNDMCKSGFCAGISAFWLVTKWAQINPSQLIYNDAWFKNTIQQFSQIDSIIARAQETQDNTEFNSIAKNYFEPFIEQIELVQDPSITTLETTQAQLDEKDNVGESLVSFVGATGEIININREYAIASLFDVEAVAKLLVDDTVIQNHKLVLINSHGHAMALFKDEDKFYYFDSECVAGEFVTTSAQAVAQRIFQVNFNRDTTGFCPLGFRMFSFGEGKNFNYPPVKQVLQNLGIITDQLSKDNKKYHWSGLRMAISMNSPESVRYFLALPNSYATLQQENNNTELGYLLVFAIRTGAQAGIIQQLIDAGCADLPGLNEALLLVARFKSDQTAIIKLLVNAGADVNTCDQQRQTPVLYAIKADNIKTIKLLLQCKLIDITQQDIHIANQQGKIHIAEELAGYVQFTDLISIIDRARQALNNELPNEIDFELLKTCVVDQVALASPYIDYRNDARDLMQQAEVIVASIDERIQQLYGNNFIK